MSFPDARTVINPTGRSATTAQPTTMLASSGLILSILYSWTAGPEPTLHAALCWPLYDQRGIRTGCADQHGHAVPGL